MTTLWRPRRLARGDHDLLGQAGVVGGRSEAVAPPRASSARTATLPTSSTQLAGSSASRPCRPWTPAAGAAGRRWRRCRRPGPPASARPARRTSSGACPGSGPEAGPRTGPARRPRPGGRASAPGRPGRRSPGRWRAARPGRGRPRLRLTWPRRPGGGGGRAGPALVDPDPSHRPTTAAAPDSRQLPDGSGVTELTASARIRLEPGTRLWRLLGTCLRRWAVVQMSGIGSGAAEARDRGGPPPRLVAVPGGRNGRPLPQPAPTVVFPGWPTTPAAWSPPPSWPTAPRAGAGRLGQPGRRRPRPGGRRVPGRAGRRPGQCRHRAAVAGPARRGRAGGHGARTTWPAAGAARTGASTTRGARTPRRSAASATPSTAASSAS